jgi:hypothetical protein
LKALHEIATDFAHEFNAKLAEARKHDPSIDLVSNRYEMGPAHIAELEELLAAPVKPLLDKLAACDIEGARRATLEAWTPLERRLRSKWQAYFVMTFQDVSVERKAARDRRKLQPRMDTAAADVMAKADATRRSMIDLVAPDESPVTTRLIMKKARPWLAVVALLALGAAGSWLLLRGRPHDAAAATANAPASPR